MASNAARGGRPRTHKWNRFLQRTAEATGLSDAELVDRLQGARSTSVRLNPLHPDGLAAITREVLDGWPSLEPLPGDPHALLCTDEAPAHELIPLAEEGKVYLQNAASLLPVLALDPQPGDTVLDVAAAPGGKAFNIAGKLAGTGSLWVNDAIRPRLTKLQSLAELYHVPLDRVTEHKAQYLDKYLTDVTFDRILVDAQCSGEGRFDLRRRNALQHWSEARVNEYTHLQTKMLDAAVRLTAPGGVIVYSTCTIAPEENELPVEKVLNRHDDLDLVPLDLGLEAVAPDAIQPGLTRWDRRSLDRRLAGAVRVLPTERFEAFFVAKLVKR